MTRPRWLSAAELDAWRTYLMTTHLLERRIEEQLKADAGLTHGQYEILVRLADAPERSIRMTELARQTVISKSALTYQVGQLEKAGLVERASCATDERGVLAVLTDEGMRTLERIAPAHVEVVREYLLDQLTSDDLGALAEIMAKVKTRLSA
ncbi:MarR family winged helix-turn-helix transcriptional regulator [Flindersiella endophytica]